MVTATKVSVIMHMEMVKRTRKLGWQRISMEDLNIITKQSVISHALTPKT